MGVAINVTLVRHGETVDNVKRLVQGHRNSVLSETGRQQAEILSKHLANDKFTRIYSSDLSRAFDTAQILVKHSEFKQPVIFADRRLRERGFGVMEGLHVSVVLEEAERLGIPIHEMVPAQAESKADVTERIKDFLEVIYDLGNGSEEQNILVVSHGAWLLNLMKYLHSNPKLFSLVNFNLAKGHAIPGNTGLTRIQIQPRNNVNDPIEIIFACLHDTSHLDSTSVQSTRSDGV